MYNKLLISAGGGIISPNQQSTQAEAATIAIGCGGTGISCLREMKKEVFNKLKPDDDKSGIPNYKHVKFLAIDTDANSLGDTNALDTIDSNTEFFNISCPDISGLLTRITELKNSPHLKWLKTADRENGQDGLSILNASAGAGGVRQIGRLLLLESSKEFTEKLTEIIKSALTDLPGDAPLNIHIFTGLGGGTGAGVFMDVCYLVQYVLKKEGLYGRAQTCGFFFLPDVNISNAPTQQVKDYIKINGFASMKELDYAMNYTSNGGKWDQQYDGFKVETTDAPVKLAHLVTATASDGAIKDNAYSYAMRVVVDYVLEFMTKPYIPEGKNASDGIFTIESHIANVNNCINMVPKKYGACYNYCVLGASNTYLPYKEITTYLASKIFESFNYLNKTLPNGNDLDLFVQTYKLKYEDISRDLYTSVPAVNSYDVDTSTLKDQCEGINSDVIPALLCQMRDSITKISNVLTANKKNLLNGVENTVVEDAKNISSLISRVKKVLLQISADPAKGPYYAAAILHSNASMDLQNKIDGYIKQNTDELSYARADLSLRDQDIANTLREFQNSNKFNRKSKGNAYVAAVHSYFTQQAKIERITVLGDLLNEFKKQLEELYSGFFKTFTKVLDELSSTFNANLTTLSNPTNTFDNYSEPLMTIYDLQESLDNSVKAMKIQSLLNHFIDDLINDEKSWISQDENKISAKVVSFFLSELTEFTQKTITDYLQIRFQTTDPNQLRKKIYNDIMINAHNKANPLFWSDASKYKISDACKIGYCSVPEISVEIQDAADDLTSLDSSIKKRVIESTDRISIFEFLCGVPMFGYKGVSNYFGDYQASPLTGAHLYEYTVEDHRDSRKLPNIAPYSSLAVEERTETQNKDSKEYDYALNNKIITVDKDINEYHIGIFDIDNYNELINEINSVVTLNDQKATQTILEKLPSMPNFKSEQIITNKGAAGYQENVVKDNALSSIDLMDEIKKQNEILRNYNDAINKLNNFLNHDIEDNKLTSDFVEALCTGVIKRDQQNVFLYTYKKEKYGMVQEVELTNITTAPYGKMPLYSAFVQYKNLDEDTRKEISLAAQKVMTTNYNAYMENTAKIKELMPAENDKIMKMATTNFELEADDILSAIGKINKQLSTIII